MFEQVDLPLFSPTSITVIGMRALQSLKKKLASSLLFASFSTSLTIPTTQSLNKRVVLFYNDVYRVVLPDTHAFPMQKYQLIRELLQSEYGHRSDTEFHVSPCATGTRNPNPLSNPIKILTEYPNMFRGDS